jgi:subtilisin family serine protease
MCKSLSLFDRFSSTPKHTTHFSPSYRSNSAATVAGKTYGVAKQANIVPVKVLDTNGSGSVSGKSKDSEAVLPLPYPKHALTFSSRFGLSPSIYETKGVVEALEWVAEQHASRNQAKSVVNMSLGGAFSQTLNDAVAAVIEAGVIAVVSAGNDNKDACGASPASEATAITVGSTANGDTRSVSSPSMLDSQSRTIISLLAQL